MHIFEGKNDNLLNKQYYNTIFSTKQTILKEFDVYNYVEA